MEYKTAYAIASKTKLKYSKKISFPTLDARLPIFWIRKVAKDYLVEMNLQGRYEVITIYIPLNYP